MSEIESREMKIKDGRRVEIRSANNSDVQNVLTYTRLILGEDIYSLTTLEEFQMSAADEEKWLESHRINPAGIVLLATFNGEIIGLLNFSNGLRKRISHTGDFGMSVANPFRRHGVGSLLLHALIKWAEENEKIEKINLCVHSTNQPAQALYRKFGFEIEGVRKKDLKYGPTEYVDTVIMGRFV